MSDQFLAEIRIFAGNFAPVGWAECNGQLLPISQNTALFSLIGTYYGGNGTSNFALPNMQGNAPMQQGQGTGLTLRDLGETGGEQTVTLITTELPSHSHTAMAGTNDGEPLPSANTWGAGAALKGHSANFYAASSNPTNVSMSASALATAGGNGPHNNLPPYLVLTFIIAMQGIYPTRS
jgi:microcystin-dependent protein